MISSADDDQREHAEDRPLGMSRFGIGGFLGGERQLFDREEEPDGERQRVEDARRTPSRNQVGRRLGRRSSVSVAVKSSFVIAPTEKTARIASESSR